MQCILIALNRFLQVKPLPISSIPYVYLCICFYQPVENYGFPPSLSYGYSFDSKKTLVISLKVVCSRQSG